MNAECKKRFFGVCLSAALSFALSHDAMADWRQVDYIVDSFLEIALKNEYSNKGWMIRKWSADGIRYRYIHHVADHRLHEELAELHLQQLQDITGLPIKPVESSQQADLTIVFSWEGSLKEDLRRYFGMRSAKQREYFFRHSVCLGSFSTNAAGVMQKAVVIIPVDRARGRAKLLACVVEELTQVLGLPNDSERVSPSIFNDRSINQLLTGLDYILLRILYDPALSPGMGRREAKPVVRTIAERFMRNGLVDQAFDKVQRGGLYSLVK